MISRQKLIEAIKKWQTEAEPEEARVMEDVICLVESQPSADQWITCSERRPRKNEVIIGTFQNDKGKTMVVTDTYFPCLLNEPWKLVAWIPLPEPYKGVE